MSKPSAPARVAPSRPGPVAEPLESRTLFALAAGFEQVRMTRVVTETATSMEFAPDGRLFIVDSANRSVRVFKNGALLTTPAITFTSSEVDRRGERGIESIVFDPNFATNKFVYLYYTKPDPDAPNTAPSDATNRLVRYRMSTTNGDVIDKSSGVVLLDGIPNRNSNHNGGAMHFGADGLLYLAIGEGGSSTATDAQDLNKYGGKVLRLNVAAVGSTPNEHALALTSNPFYNAADGINVRDLIFAYGFRNPFTGNIRPGTNTLFVNDVGGSQWEEINHVQSGRNYGWPIKEGNTTDTTYTNPIHTYTHFPNGTSQPRVQAAITGGVFYSGSHFPASYNGKYFFADYLRKFIKVLDPATNQVTDFFTNGPTDTLDVVDLDVGPDGRLWTLSLTGSVRRYSFVGTANRAPTAVASADKTSGATPLVVNFSGAGSSDPDGDGLSYAWSFSDGTSATGSNVQKTFNNAGTYTARLTVSDGRGGSDQSDLITVVAGSQRPTAAITSPVVGSTYGGGQTISFAGTGTDPEDGTLAATRFDWKVVFHHADHTHTFIPSIADVKSGTFVIPTSGEQDPDQFYRVHLTVTDSAGISHTVTRDVQPRTSTITLNTSAPGLQVSLDGTPMAAGTSVVSVEGMTRVLSAATPQTVGAKTFAFASWSDGGARTHNIATPVANTTYTATFTQTAGPVDVNLAPRADAYVRDGASANSNFGENGGLVVKRSSTIGNTRETHVKFDLTGVAAGAGQTVKLRLWGRLSDTINNNLILNLYPVADATWGENSITWNTRPASGATALDFDTISGTTGRWYEWDVTNYVRAEKAAGRNGIAFALKRATATDTQILFNSDEAASNRPVLVIAAAAPAATITTTVASYVRGGAFAGQNFGSDPSLLVKRSATADNIRESYLKFDLSTVTTITSAKLRLFGKLSAASAAGVAIGVYSSTNTSWTEAGITYSNRPPTGSTALATTTITGTGGAWFEWNLTGFLQAEKAAGRNVVTLALKAPNITDPWAIFNADSQSNAPQLVIT